MANAPDLQAYLDIKAQLQAKVTQSSLAALGYKAEWAGPIEVELFNNQFENGEKGLWSPKALPMIVVGFVQTTPWMDIGNGVQYLTPFDIRIHIIFEWYNDDDTDRDTDINEAKIQMQIRQLIYESLQLFIPSNCGNLTRTDERLDENHTNMIHYIQIYRTSLIDSTLNRPVGGSTSGVVTLDLTVDKVNEITPE